MVVSAREGYNLLDIIRDFKGYTAKKIIEEILINPKESRQEWILRLLKYHAKFNKNNKLHQFWKKGNHPVELITKKWIGIRIEYTHNNPVKAGFVDNQRDYIYSSARKLCWRGRHSGY